MDVGDPVAALRLHEHAAQDAGPIGVRVEAVATGRQLGSGDGVGGDVDLSGRIA